MLKLYEFALSGNCHKVRLFLSILNEVYTAVPVNGSRAEQKSAAFLQLNPFGQVPVLVDGDLVLRDSQAILVYLATRDPKGRFYPADPTGQARVQSWLSVAAHEMSRGPALLRLHHKFGKVIDLPAAQQVATELLTLVNNTLTVQSWFAGESPSIADIAMYPYLALAHEGLLDLQAYPAIRRWLHAVESLPGYLPMPGISLQH